MKVFHTLPKLIRHAEQNINRFDVISFDVFDTVFVRRIHDPDMVKFPVARYIAARAARLGISTTWREVWDLRDRIEAEHRVRNGRTHPDHEARYDDYMSEMLMELFGERLPDDLFEAVADYEMTMEAAVLVPRREVVDWIKRLHAMGKKILLISDIYLPAKYLKRLAAENGLMEYVSDLISSADSFNAKASGAGYALIQGKHQIDYDRWLHVGDNGISDGVRPSEHGITALVIQDLKEKQRKGIARLINYYSSIKHFWKGRNVQQLMLPLEGENIGRPALYVEGHNLFGFIIGYFIQALAEQCRQRGLKRVYFCSREGWMFFECWKRMIPFLFPEGDAPQASYLYVSRIGLSRAACANSGLTFLNASVALLPAENQDFLDMCRIFRLDIDKLRPMLAAAKLAEDEVITAIAPGDALGPNDPFTRLLENPAFQDEVKRQGRDTRNVLEKYLQSEGFFDHQDVALVDIGWLGTIQHYLHEAISHRDQRPNIHGFLLAGTRMVPYPASDKCRSNGLIFDQFNFNLATSYILTIKAILEEVCRAPHAGVIDYQLVDGDPGPVFRSDGDAVAAAEAAQSERFATLHQGVFDAVRRYAAMVTLLDYPTRHLKPWLNFFLVTRLAFPRAQEVESIKHIAHQDDFTSNRKVARSVLRYHQSLWDIDSRIIKYVPFIRLRYFWIHISRMLRLWS